MIAAQMLPYSPMYTRANAESVKREVDGFASKFVLPSDGVFTQWDGTKGTFSELMDRMLAIVKQSCNETEHWVKLGVTHGITREYHPARTAQGNGNRYFRYTGLLKTPPQLLCASLLEPQALGEIDTSLRHARVLANLPDGRCRVVTVCAEAGPRPLFYDRDDCNLTTYYPPTAEDPCWYQVSVTIPSHLPSVSTAVRNHTMVWGYRFRPVIADDGSKVYSQTTLISQTEIFGWIPKFSVNMMVSPILSEYLRKLEHYTQSLEAQPARMLVESYGLSLL